jgi:predicted DCC family thiol-disulfide oxidoreductase YuxK
MSAACREVTAPLAASTEVSSVGLPIEAPEITECRRQSFTATSLYAQRMATVIYDADCGLCRFTLALLLTWDRRRVARSRSERGRPCPPNQQVRWARSAAICALRPLPLGTPEADRLLADLTEAERNASWHLVDDAGRRNSAGAALPPALELLPGGRIPAAVLSRAPHLTERAYRWVADHRSFLGRFVPQRARRWADRVIAAHGAAP